MITLGEWLLQRAERRELVYGPKDDISGRPRQAADIMTVLLIREKATLDIPVFEHSSVDMFSGRGVYEPPRTLHLAQLSLAPFSLFVYVTGEWAWEDEDDERVNPTALLAVPSNAGPRQQLPNREPAAGPAHQEDAHYTGCLLQNVPTQYHTGTAQSRRKRHSPQG